jgi:nucleoside-diphosphate-sugar epimerase
MRTLIIGGTLFIGAEIVRRLVTRGHDVTVLHRRAQHDLGPEVRNLQADRGDLDKLRALLRAERFDAVFDVAYDWTKGTTAADVEAAARSGGDELEHYVFVSSIAAYGPGLDHRETDALVPDDDPRVYARNKAASERALFRLHEASGFPVTTFRPPYVHGPRQPFYREQFFWDRLLDGRPIILPDGGTSMMQWVYVGDLAEACVRALEVPEARGEAFNIAHASITQRGFVETAARVAGMEPRFAAVSREEILAAGGQVSGANLYFGEALDMPPTTEVVEKAPRVLGFAPMDFESALRESFAGYREQPRRPRDYALEDRLLNGV